MPDRSLPQEPRSRPWIWVVYVLLFAASVPWYLPAGSPPRIWIGLPHWVVISLAAYLAVAVFTAWVVAHYWSVPAGEGAADGGGETGGATADRATADRAAADQATWDRATTDGTTAGGASSGRAPARNRGDGEDAS